MPRTKQAASSSASSAAAAAADPVWVFPHPFHEGDYEVGAPPKTVAELRLMNLSAAIRAKPEWETKRGNLSILAKWKQEAAEQGVGDDGFAYVIKELEYYAKRKTDKVQVGGVDGTWVADKLIPDAVKADLQRLVRRLEDVPEHLKDWHPGSHNQVLDLVHPSLFPLIYDVSHSLPPGTPSLPFPDNINAGTVLVSKPKRAAAAAGRRGRGRFMAAAAGADEERAFLGISAKFQWLPTEFSIGADGKVRIENYINNLHPAEHKELYGTIATVFEQFVPLFNNALTDMLNPLPNRVEVDPYGWYPPQPIDIENDDDAYDAYLEHRVPIQPTVPEYKEHPAILSGNTVDLKGRTVQVIVKMAEIVLTPENPEYKGGAWHVEGMQEEHIIATGIYYYHSENITFSKLMFRQAVSEPGYEQNDNNGVAAIYNLHNDEPLNQDLGFCETKEDRCLVFPNIYQHRVASFRLQDPTKRGLRKILVFFLVDPNAKGHTTSTIPPQRTDWFVNALVALPAMHTFPTDLVKIIGEYATTGMTMEEAKAYRLELMEERKYFRTQHSESLFERPFSLCEH